MTRREIIDGLREAADFIEAHPDLPVRTYTPADLTGIVDTAEEVAAVARMLGKADKRFFGDWIEVARDFGPVRLGVAAGRGQVCERVVVGTKTVKRPITETVGIEEVEEEIVEWECGPLLEKAA